MNVIESQLRLANQFSRTEEVRVWLKVVKDFNGKPYERWHVQPVR